MIEIATTKIRRITRDNPVILYNPVYGKAMLTELKNNFRYIILEEIKNKLIIVLQIDGNFHIGITLGKRGDLLLLEGKTICEANNIQHDIEAGRYDLSANFTKAMQWLYRRTS